MKPIKLIIFSFVTVVMLSSYLIFTQMSKRDYYIKTLAGSEKIGSKIEVTTLRDGTRQTIIPSKTTITTEGTKRAFNKYAGTWESFPEKYEKYYNKIFRSRYGMYERYFDNDKYVGLVYFGYEKTSQFSDPIPEIVIYDKEKKEKREVKWDYKKINGYGNVYLKNVIINDNTITLVTNETKSINFTSSAGSARELDVEYKLRAFSYNIISDEWKLLDENKVALTIDTKDLVMRKNEEVPYLTDTDTIKEVLETNNPFMYIISENSYSKKDEHGRGIGKLHFIYFDMVKGKFMKKYEEYKNKEDLAIPHTFIIEGSTLYSFNQLKSDVMYKMNLEDWKTEEIKIKDENIDTSSISSVTSYSDENLLAFQAYSKGKVEVNENGISEDTFNEVLYVINSNTGEVLYKGQVVYKKNGKTIHAGDEVQNEKMSFIE